MAKFGKTPIHDADKAKPTIQYVYNGEDRIERFPSGKAARFVDPAGNVVSLQLVGAGDANAATSEHRARLRAHADGFIEHGRCPVLHSMTRFPGKIAADFAGMPAHLHEACTADPKALVRRDGELHATESCRHVEFIIAHRRAKEAADRAKRMSKMLASEQVAADRAELERLQLEKLRAEVAAQNAQNEKPTKGRKE